MYNRGEECLECPTGLYIDFSLNRDAAYYVARTSQLKKPTASGIFKTKIPKRVDRFCEFACAVIHNNNGMCESDYLD